VPGSVHVGFMADSGTGTGFSLEFFSFPRQYHSALALHTYISPGG
jgi:hypothetical protein